MLVKSFSEAIVVGGLQEYNKKNVLLRMKHIEDGLNIHTCNDYSNSLEVIKEASSKAGKDPKIISKVYYKYPNCKHRRFRTIKNQLNETKDRLMLQPKSWKLQLCCRCDPKILIKGYGQDFIEMLKNEFKVDGIYFEIYPNYRLDYNSIYKLNNKYSGQFNFGVIGYQNLESRVFENVDLSLCRDRNIDLGFIGFLGLGSKDRTLGISNKSGNLMSDQEKINVNTAYLLYAIKLGVASFGITAVSSEKQYSYLKEIYKVLETIGSNPYLENLIEHLITTNHFTFRNYDQYSVNYSAITPFAKSLAFRLYNTLMHRGYFSKIGNGFF